MKLKKIFLLFGSILALNFAWGQSSFQLQKKEASFNIDALPLALNTNKKIIAPFMLITPYFYSEHLSFFCRQEIKFEKATKIPFKFRVGSVQYVDYLERKPNAIFLP